MPEPIEVTRLRQALDQFKGRMPRDLPRGVTDALEGLEKQLGEQAPERDTPGSRAAAEAQGTGVPMEKAARGPDAPSPGQREAQGRSGEMSEAAQAIVERLASGSRKGTEAGAPRR